MTVWESLVLMACGAVLLAVAGGLTAWRTMIWMPGRSFRGEIRLTDDELLVRETLRRDLTVLAEEIGERHLSGRSRQLFATAEFIARELESAGYQPRCQEFVVEGTTVWNIDVERTGEMHPEEIIIVGAHYDTVPGSPGANDNGTAVVANLALARAFADIAVGRSLRLAFFVNEESPYHMTPNMGSLRYAQELRTAGERVVGMISLEMLGCFLHAPESQRYPVSWMSSLYPTRGNFLAVVGNIASRRWLHQIVRGLRESEIPVEGLAAPNWLRDIFRSDHAAFWQCGYPAVMVTDTANFRYRHYHTAEDTIDKIDFDTLTRVTTALRECLRRQFGIADS